MSIVWSVIGFVVVMGLIVTIHEWGHFQVARWFNIKVLKFSIGFGKPIYSIKGQETEFVISQIPLGGYVTFADEREGNVAPDDVHRAFNRQSVYKRFAVVAAGPLINLLFAWLVFTVMYMVGLSGIKPLVEGVQVGSALEQAMQKNHAVFDGDQAWSITQVNGSPVYSWQMVQQKLLNLLAEGKSSVDFTFNNLDKADTLFIPKVSLASIDIDKPNQNWLKKLGLLPAKPFIPPVLGEVVKGGAASQAGLKAKDKILALNDVNIYSWQDFVKAVQAHPNQSVNVSYERNQAVYNSVVKIGSIRLDDGQTVGQVGAAVFVDKTVLKPYVSTIQYGFIDSSIQAYHRSIELFTMSVTLLKRMILGEVSTKNLSGPISIAQFSGQAIQTGLVAFLSLVGLLSLSIGILNLLPIPVLDGGHLMFYFVEMFKGSPVSERVMVVGQTVGLIVIIGLTLLALFNDVIRISHG